jgi:hypothetical protein
MTEQSAASAAPLGTIRLTIQGSVMTSNLLTPTLRINGHPVPTRYGTQDIPVYPGPNHLDMEAQWMRTYGQAAIDTTVAPGQVVEVWYASPLHQFARGNIGFTKQQRPGMGCMLVLLGFLALCAALVVVGIVADALA